MRFSLRYIMIAAAALLAASCHLDFIDENNTLCKNAWAEESVSIYDSNGILIGFTDKTVSASYVRFVYNGTWIYESESLASPEYGFWSTEVVPRNDASFEVILIADEPGSFVRNGHSGEPYSFTLSQSGDTLEIIHRHYDEPEYSLTRFLRSSR